MPNRNYLKSILSSVATVGLVASAMTAVLYANPVQAVSTEAAVVSPANGSTFTAGVPTSFKFSVKNNSAATSAVRAAIGGVTSSFTATTAVAPSASCTVAVSTGYSLTGGCAELFTAAGLAIANVPANTSVEVTVNSLVSNTTPANTNDDLKFNVFSTTGPTLGAADDNSITATYNAVYGNALSITKEKVDTAKFGGTLPAAPNNEAMFAIVLENTSQVPFTSVVVKDYLDTAIKTYFTSCVATDSAAPYATGATFTTANGTEVTSSAFTVPAAPSNTTTSRVAFYVGCDRGTTVIPDGTTGNNVAEVSSFTHSSDSSYGTLPNDSLRARASIAGSGNLKIEKTLVSKSTTEITSGTVATYRIKVTNTANRDSDPALVADIFQVPAGVTVETGTAPLGGDITNPFEAGSSTIRAVDVSSGVNGLAAAYPANIGAGGTLGNTARVFRVGKLRANDAFMFNYTVTYRGAFPTTCGIDQAAAIVRNTAALAALGTVANGATVTGTNDLTVGTTASFVKFDGSTITVNNAVIYQDTVTSDNAVAVDSSSNICEPDMQLVDKRKSGPNDMINQAMLGEETVYTIRYRNLAANTKTAPVQPRSAATGVTITDMMPEGATFVRVESPKEGANATVSGSTVTVTVPNIALGDDGIKELKLVIKQTNDMSKANTEVINKVKVAAAKEIAGFMCENYEVDNLVTPNGCEDTNTASDTAGNNVAMRKLTLKGGPDVAVTKTVDIGEGQLKTDTSMLTYTVKVKNVGSETANSVMVRDTLPTCTTFDSKVSGPDGVLTTDGRNIDYNAGNMEVNKELVMVFKVKINQTDACKINNSTIIQNSATATISSSQMDLNVSNNTGIANSSVVALNQNAMLMKTVDQMIAQPGATLNYTITLKGAGAAFKGTIVDELPAGVTFVSAEPGVTTRDGGKLTWTNVSVDNGKELKAMVKVTVNNDATGTLVNRVMATTTDGKMNAASASTTIEVAGNSKVTGFVYFDANRNKKNDTKERDDKMYGDYLAGIRVMAVASNGKEYTATTDRMGAFTFDKLPAGKYTVKVDISTVKGSYKNVALNVAATDPSNDGLTKVAEVRANESFDLTAAFRLFTNQTNTGAATSNGIASISGLVAVLSFSFLVTLFYAEARNKAFRS